MSPTIHNAALRHDKRDAVYLAFDVTDVPAALDGLAALGAIGANVTIPHKRAAWEHAPRHSPEAVATGVANTVVFDRGRMEAHNTDPAGVLGGLHDLGVSAEGLRCLVVGAGGAGRAAVRALHSAGAAEVQVANRTTARAADLGPGRVVAWEALPDALAWAEVVIHATSVGMAGEDTFLQVSALSPSRCRGVLDLVYGRHETDLVRKVAARGIAAADGLGVLVYQAAESYELFWGAPAPFSVMQEAAFRATGRRWH